MFKIESYITPIIINHVAKYVKNIRSQDAQISLWEGEVVFQNLDLRLDVLEQELKLPFELLSGHIHELSILVPWTRITSEPIRITINTIEFVMKNKSHNHDATSTSSSQSSPSKGSILEAQKKKRQAKQDEIQAQQSMAASLVSKIINNITVQCHNIILKYVEEDIVLSMNVQLLSFTSADEKWRSAMVDVNPVNVLIRKLIHISDLTVCLDKRNAAGQIDVCQEPIMYRCTLECRILRKYNVSSMETTSTTRVGVFTKSMDMNISSLQFPMAMRLIKLILSFNSDKVKNPNTDIADHEQEEQTSASNEDTSYWSWAWNLLPMFAFESPEEDTNTDNDPPGHTIDIGFYVEEMNFTLKNSEFVNDTVMGSTKRIRYTPIVRVSFGGMYFERVFVEARDWSSFKAGLSSVVVEPLGNLKSDYLSSASLIDAKSEESTRSFIDKSLFDEQCLIADKGWGVTNYDEYATRITEDYLLYRSPIMALDIVEYKTPPEERVRRASVSSTTGIDMDTHRQYRFLSAGVTLRFSQTLLQVKNIIKDFVDSYDYPAYHAERLDWSMPNIATKLPPPFIEDYDALMQNVPVCTYKFNLKKIKVEIYPKVSSNMRPRAQRRSSTSYKSIVPYFIIGFDQLEGTLKTPLQPEKVVHTTCQLPVKPQKLIDACYDNYNFALKEFAILIKTTSAKSKCKLVHIPSLQLYVGQLLYKLLWREMDIPELKIRLTCKTFNVTFSKLELLLASRLAQCVVQYKPNLLQRVAKQATHAIELENVKLSTNFHGLHVEVRYYFNCFILFSHLHHVQSDIYYQKHFDAVRHTILLTHPNANNRWLELQFQSNTKSSDRQKKWNTIALWMEPYRLMIDKHLLDFLSYQEEVEDTEIDIEIELNAQQLHMPPVLIAANLANTSVGHSYSRRSTRTQAPARRVSQPEETIHISSDRDDKPETIFSPMKPQNLQHERPPAGFLAIRYLTAHIDMKHGRIDIAEVLERNNDQKILCMHTKVLLPKITVKSQQPDSITNTHMLQKFKEPNWKESSKFTIELYDMTIQLCHQKVLCDILRPVHTTITIALTHKEVKMKSKTTEHVTQNDDSQTESVGRSPSTETFMPETDSVETLTSLEDIEPRYASVSAAPQQDGIGSSAKTSTKLDKSGKALKDVIILTIHVDTTPIYFLISAQNVRWIQNHSKLLLEIARLATSPPSGNGALASENTAALKVLTANEDNPIIRDFLEMETNSSKSPTQPQKAKGHLMATSTFCQWTIAKFTLELDNSNISNKSKVILEFEDFLSTLDRSEDFIKFTSKVGNVNLRYYKPNATAPGGEMQCDECLSVKMLSQPTQLPFLNIIYTKVCVKSFYDKLGIKSKSKPSKQLAEVVIKMQGIELIIDLDQIKEFIHPLCLLLQKEPDSATDALKADRTQQVPLSAASLPMIHLDGKGIMIYMPLQTGRTCCSVVLWNIGKFKITPIVENPLQRNPLRIDVYSKAAQMGILSTPGSLIEDRQYELSVKQISSATGNWAQILARMREQTNNFLHTNPAFEWNNQKHKSVLQLAEIFSNFSISIIYAPSIIYNNILICGQALELNCASDFVASVDVYQINLFNCMILRLQSILCFINEVCYNAPVITSGTLNNQPRSKSSIYLTAGSETSDSLRSTKSLSALSTLKRCSSADAKQASYLDARIPSSFFDTIDENTEHNLKSDSGFHSAQSRNLDEKTRSTLLERIEYTQPRLRQLPYTLSFVAGVFLIKIYAVQREESKSDELPERIPLLSATILQPSFMITQNMYDTITNISLFNLNILMSNATHSAQKSSLFPEKLLETGAGEVNAAGIPPTFLSLKCHRTKMQMLELEIDIAKPVAINLTENSIKTLISNLLVIYRALLENPCMDFRSQGTIVRGSKIKLMQQHCFNADRLHFKCNKIELKLLKANVFNCRLCFADLNFNVKFLNRPEKATFLLNFGSIWLHTDKKILLHPVHLRLSIDFVHESWHRLPIVLGTAKFNSVLMDLGIYSLLQVRMALESIQNLQQYGSEEYQKFLNNLPPTTEETVQRERLRQYKCPAISSVVRTRASKKCYPREEYYQDDLRAGAFQFVETTTDNFLPLPYQIQIIKKNYGIICWRYPQPRKMCKIHVSPVPMPITSPMHIKCHMEYFSEVNERFLPFCVFEVSETTEKEIMLPDREVCAHIWRVIILQSIVSVDGDCFDTSEEDEEIQTIPNVNIKEILCEDQPEQNFVLHPKLLVGCMRIDTAFQSKCVPKVQFLVTCNLIKLKLMNQPDQNALLPNLIKRYKLRRRTDTSQTFLSIKLNNIHFNSLFYTRNTFNMDYGLNMGIKCLDTGFLNLLSLLEKTKITGLVRVNEADHSVDAYMVIDKLRFNFGPSLALTLLSSKMHWQELLEGKPDVHQHAVIPKCMVVNRTYSNLSFGQTGTTERVQLHPLECTLYAFCSDYHNQELTFFIADENTKITEASQSVPLPFKFAEDSIIHPIRIGKNCLIIKTIKLSTTQVLVLIKGQIEFLSMVPHSLKIDFQYDDKKHDNQISEYELLPQTRISFYRCVFQHTGVKMRIKFDKCKSRSGDIPLHKNRNLPWLVKVPTLTNSFVSFWVRVLRENLSELTTEVFKPQRILIIIWPVFEIRSMLTASMVVKDNESTKVFHVDGEGSNCLLDLPVTHMSEHNLRFKFSFPVEGMTLQEYTISLRNINWQDFFWFDDRKWTIEYTLNFLAKFQPNRWPFEDRAEIRLRRNSALETKSAIVYHCKRQREFSCVRTLEVSPWLLFINGTEFAIEVRNKGSNIGVQIDPNNLEMLPTMKKSIVIAMKNNSTWIPSEPIYLMSTGDTTPTEPHYVLTDESPLELTFLRGREIAKLIVELRVDNERKAMRLRSKYAIANFSSIKLSVLTFAVEDSEAFEISQVANLSASFKKKPLLPTEHFENSKGVMLGFFHDLSSMKVKRTIESRYCFFICVQLCDELSFSIPIPLSEPFPRICFSLQKGSESIPMVASLIESDGVHYLTIFEDKSPIVLIQNQTNIEFLVAHTSSQDTSKLINVTPEHDGTFFCWHQAVRPMSKCYYTPPNKYRNFPDIEHDPCNLTLAVTRESEVLEKKEFKWSKPIRIDKTMESFHHVPCQGDVKIIICDKHRTVRLTIQYIAQQQEFSVKDLRTRLLMPNLITSDSDFDVAAMTDVYKDVDATSNQSATDVSQPLDPNFEPKCIHAGGHCQPKTTVKWRFFVKEFIFSLNTDSKVVDSIKTEIVGIYIDDMWLTYDQNANGRGMSARLTNLQIDNQLYESRKFDFPVIMCSEMLYKRTTEMPYVYNLDKMYEKSCQAAPMIGVCMSFYDDELSLRSVVCKAKPLRIYIENEFVSALQDALTECDPSKCVHRLSHDQPLIEIKDNEILLPHELINQALSFAEPLSLHSFRIEQLQTVLSVHFAGRFYFALDHSPLTFSSFDRQHLYTIPSNLGYAIGTHYMSGALIGAGWVLGSIGILGSPSVLARLLTTGLRDFVSMPVAGLFRGPWAFIVGITQGSASLLRNITAGTVNSVTTLAAAVARNLDRLSLDEEHIERTETMRRTRPQGFSEGLSQGVTGLGISLLGAVGGIARHTLEAKSTVEVVTGMGKGLVGAFTKPISGAAELVALAGQGVLYTVGFDTMPQQRLPPTNSNNISEPAPYRIWKLLPTVLASDQVLFYNKITLVTQEQMRQGWIFLTSAVFTLVEDHWDKLSFACPIEKVEVICDRDDKTLFYVQTVQDREQTAEDIQYTKQRIMSFLHSSSATRMNITTDSFDDLLMNGPHTSDRRERRMYKAFHINDYLGEYLITYIKILKSIEHS